MKTIKPSKVEGFKATTSTTETINGVTITCLVEIIEYYRELLSKPPKGTSSKTATPRVFPTNYGSKNWPMIETVDEDGVISINYQGDPVYSKLQIDTYVKEYCKLNRLVSA